MTKLYVREGTLGVRPGKRGRPLSSGDSASVRGDAEKTAEVQSQLRVLELDQILRTGRTLKRAG
jgi:hypothetical protein